jgi:hypothetical protein
MARGYANVKVLLPEIKEMVGQRKSQREIAEHFGFKDKYVIKELLKRERRTERKIEAGISPKAKGRPRKDGESPRQKEKTELERLRMENKLLRDFLQNAGRR